MKKQSFVSQIIKGLLLLALGFFLAWLFLPRSEAGTTTTEVAASGSDVWTCAMHPQIRQDQPGDCPICGMDLTLLAQSSGNETENVLTMTASSVSLADIRVSPVAAAARGKTLLHLYGYVAADEGRKRSLAAHFPGRIEKMYVSSEGEYVKKGSTIAKIYSPQVVNAQEELLEAIRFRDLNPGLVDAARRKMRLWKIPEAQIAAIEKSGKVNEELPVHADVGGTVLVKKAQQGDHVHEGQVLFDVADLSVVWVIFEVYEQDLARIRRGSPLEFNVPSLPAQTFKGKVTFVNPVVDKKKGVAFIRTEIRNPKGLLKPGMHVKGRLIDQADESSSWRLMVPESAVLWTGKRSVVYVSVPGTDVPTFAMREVELGDKTEAGYEILSGLGTEESVVTQGAFVVDATAELNNKRSMMNRDIAVRKPGQQPAAPELPDYLVERLEGVSPQFIHGFSALLNAYMAVKDALVASNANKTAMAASNIVMQVPGVPAVDLSAEALEIWKQVGEEARLSAGIISGTKVLSVQRDAFIRLSNAIKKGANAFGTEEGIVYLQHCPMANNNQGADWLSHESEIQNPYFGDQMLKCGSVKQKIAVRTAIQ